MRLFVADAFTKHGRARARRHHPLKHEGEHGHIGQGLQGRPEEARDGITIAHAQILAHEIHQQLARLNQLAGQRIEGAVSGRHFHGGMVAVDS
jgi:hypothetical protein